MILRGGSKPPPYGGSYVFTITHRLGGNLESKLPATEDGGHYKVYRYFTVCRSFRHRK